MRKMLSEIKWLDTETRQMGIDNIESRCSTENPEEKEYYLLHAVHAPMEARVQIPLQNSKDFSEAFGCQKDSKMNQRRKSNLWDN
ncbi:membrane metallo-endopeptidase-like 1 isoform X2 [Octopus vulgaris]|uniref:Membrane metallo-endopeptidase-like 1 isoform X2 n=1 Tax=Octopus vulgaris TaxID=6645 RepID=A0AA36B1Y9_OCTVU|nr:membrane metallo-endopeptidase-like 1 isoform X2 [Octopus vulgaris]